MKLKLVRDFMYVCMNREKGSTGKRRMDVDDINMLRFPTYRKIVGKI